MLCVETERFEIERDQLAHLTLFAWVVLGVGVLLDIVMVGAHGHGLVLDWGAGLTIAGLIGLWARTAYARAYTEVSADGIKTRGIFGTRKAAWAEVRDIRLLDYQVRGMSLVKVVLRGGRSFRLGAPVHSQVMPDPAFTRKVERIGIAAARQRALHGAAPGPGV